ncbi:MAG TPA: hypothetical protein VHC20_04480 [Candidatus Paceibacterota bacterium]|nr:hypothetical protein [Candidatus Paceibacterota bacterium]
MNNLATAVNDILTECREDYVGLWSVIRQLRRGGIEEAAVFETTMNLLSTWLHEGKIVAGSFDTRIDNDFHVWQMSPDEALARIAREWRGLGHDPNLGDVVWITTAPPS